MQSNKDQQPQTIEPKRIELAKNANIAEVVSQYPEVVEIFAAFGLHCASCFASQFDTISDGAKLHGMLDDEIDEMIEEANKVINAVRGLEADNDYDISV